MPIYLAYETAVEAIALLRTREKDGTPWRKPSRKRSIADALHTRRELISLIEEVDARLAKSAKSAPDQQEEPDNDDNLFYIDELTDLTQEEIAERKAASPDPAQPSSILSKLSRPLHILVPTRESCAQTDTLAPHLWSTPIPERSFIEVEPGVFLSTPAFTFLQMATERSEVGLIQLAMEFCGFYAHGPSGKGMVFEIDPVCSSKILDRYVARAAGCNGAKLARKALPMVVDHAASHMETALYLLLCLPMRMGGYGLPKPELNPKVVVEQASGSSTCYPDLYWRGPSIDVEYDSDAEHSGPSAHYKDSRRMVAIVCNRITLLSISTGQLYRTVDLDNAAHGLARMLKHRVRRTDDEWKRQRMLLRAAVLPYRGSDEK